MASERHPFTYPYENELCLKTKVRNYNHRFSFSDSFLSLLTEEASAAPSLLHCCKSATEYDRQGEAIDRGCSGGNEGGDTEFELEFEFESSLVLLRLSELLMATARASVLLLELSGRFAIPQPLLL